MFVRLDREAGIRAGVSLWNLEYPDYLNTEAEHASALRHNPEGSPEVHAAIFEDGRAVASLTMENHEEERPVRYLEGELLCHPDRMRDLIPATLDELRKIAREYDVEYLSVWCQDRFPQRDALFRDAGLTVIQTVPVSRLEVASFDPAPFADKVEAVRSKYRLTSAADLDAEGHDWIPALWETSWEIASDIPGPHLRARPSLEDYRQRLRSETVFYQTDTMVFAMEGERIVGYSRVTLSDAMSHLALTGMSGTVRSHRRQGIVTALKVLGIEKMQAKGITILQTDNDETNPMFQLNLALGFKPCWNWRQWRLDNKDKASVSPVSKP